MKKLVLLLLLLPCFAYSQYDCDNYAAAGVSYILPKSVAGEVSYFTRIGFTAGVGAAYTVPTRTRVKDGQAVAPGADVLDLFAYVGYRIIRVEERFSAYLNAGGAMGDVNGVKTFVSARLLFPWGPRAVGIEPFYTFNRGLSGRATVYFKF